MPRNFLLILPFLLPLAFAASPETEIAARNAREASAAAWQAHRVMHAWLKRLDPVTGLLPRMGTNPNWFVQDSAADLYPFLVIESRFFDLPVYQREMSAILRREMLLTRRSGELSDDFAAGGRGWVFPELNLDRIIFGSSEYAKDGLLPLSELLGDTPWYQRLNGIASDIARQAPYSSPRGKLPAATSEVNGNMLQVYSRLAWKTRRPEYLQALWAIADFYLLDTIPKTGWLPPDLWDFASGRPAADRSRFVLSDHGNEIVGGLSEALLLARHLEPERAKAYQPAFLKMIDRLLEVGRNPDGVWVSRIDLESGKQVDTRHAHCWGYMFNGVWVAWMVSGQNKYRQAVEHAISAVTEKTNYLFDETGAGRNWGSNAYSDSLESALVLYNRAPNPRFAEAIDAATVKFLARVRPDGIVEDWYGDGNFIRTAVMYVFWKTQGAWLSHWHPRVHLGAVPTTSGVELSLAAESPWQGRLHFDTARHRAFWGMAVNYPRLNEWPEWFTAEPNRVYAVAIGGAAARDYLGWELVQGIPLAVEAGSSLSIRVTTRPQAR